MGAKLYRAYSIVEEYDGYKNVRFDWFMKQREEPVVRYQEVLSDYMDLSGQDLKRARLYVDEFFTAGEVEQLRTYLREQHGEELVIKTVKLPQRFRWLDTDGWLVTHTPFGPTWGGGQDAFYPIPNELGYTPPFQAWAVCNFTHGMWLSAPPCIVCVRAAYCRPMARPISHAQTTCRGDPKARKAA
jgi:hypothetical protein